MISSQSAAHRVKESPPTIHVRTAHTYALEGVYACVMSERGGAIYDASDNVVSRHATHSELFAALTLLSSKTERTIIKLIRE